MAVFIFKKLQICDVEDTPIACPDDNSNSSFIFCPLNSIKYQDRADSEPTNTHSPSFFSSPCMLPEFEDDESNPEQ
ncbi:MAG TPA: hypothetical protein VIH57_05990 [Bacteroidales bacterium]